MEWDYHVPQTPLHEPRNKNHQNIGASFLMIFLHLILAKRPRSNLSDISDTLGQVGTSPPKCLLHFATHIMSTKLSEDRIQEPKINSK